MDIKEQMDNYCNELDKNLDLIKNIKGLSTIEFSSSINSMYLKHIALSLKEVSLILKNAEENKRIAPTGGR